MPLPVEPWEKLAIDTIGPLKNAPDSCKYAITLIDYFSRWPKACFSRVVTVSTVKSFLLTVFSREGHLQKTVSDNGPQFVSSDLWQFLTELGIKHSFASVYYPSGNGMIEKFNCVFKDLAQPAALE